MNRGWRRWALLAVCAVIGAALNIYRDVWWHSGTPPQMSGFCAPAELQALNETRFAPGYCRIEIPETSWRPLAVTLQLRAPSPLPLTAAVIGTAARLVHISVDDPTEATDAQTVSLDETWRPFTVIVTTPPRSQVPLALALRVDQPRIPDPMLAYVTAAPLAGRVDATPILTVRSLAWPALAGAIFGIVTALLFPPIRRGAPGRALNLSPSTTLVTCGALLLYFVVWAVARPPYQTPDEVQHQMRTSSVLRDPWVAQPGRWTVDARYTNPLAYWPPQALNKLPFNPTQRLSRGDVTAMKRVAWLAPSALPPGEAYERAIASYPTLYYLSLFAVAEPITRLAGISPYDSSYVYRIVSAAFAAICWTLVFVQLRRLPATRESATAIGAVLVLNPMTAFMSSAVNVDAVNIPLAILASLLYWRLLTTGEGEWWTLAALLATSWTKPSGLQLIGSLFVATAALWAARQPIALKRALLTLSRGAMVSWITFYAWSPPRFLGSQPSFDTITTYIANRWSRAFDVWIMYWGRLGWLEYNLAPIWYVLVLIAVVIGVACAVWRPRGSRAFMVFATTLFAAFIAATLAGEFMYLPVSGYVLQGRHLLPASLGLAVLVMHRVTAARVALIALLVLLNVLLIQASVDRYYNGQWRVATYALPFTR